MNLEIACMTLGNLLCWGCQSVSCVSVLYENRKFAARFSKNHGFVKPWVVVDFRTNWNIFCLKMQTDHIYVKHVTAQIRGDRSRRTPPCFITIAPQAEKIWVFWPKRWWPPLFRFVLKKIGVIDSDLPRLVFNSLFGIFSEFKNE